jgi:hypothetical protein
MFMLRSHASVPLRLSIFGVEVELYCPACPLFGRVHHAGIEGPRIHVQADGALVEFARIHHAMNGIGWVDGAGMRDIHLDRVGGFEPAGSTIQVLMNEMKIFHVQTADGNGHPAILVAMIVHRTGLADLPANGHQFVKRSPVDEIASVVLPVPVQVRSERVSADGSVLQKTAYRLGWPEGGLGQLAQAVNESLDGNRFYSGRH